MNEEGKLQTNSSRNFKLWICSEQKGGGTPPLPSEQSEPSRTSSQPERPSARSTCRSAGFEYIHFWVIHEILVEF